MTPYLSNAGNIVESNELYTTWKGRGRLKLRARLCKGQVARLKLLVGRLSLSNALA